MQEQYFHDNGPFLYFKEYTPVLSGHHYACNISKRFVFEKEKSTPKQNTRDVFNEGIESIESISAF